ncbi:MAG TPA: protocatechuate 3,4-dioxygenase [Candidatus Limnocylindria bacterium]|jgi:hypothetical protein|nr:protocatechuate 3,4-dioxygenase [Candidatus Limnocylindria bacterium]
MAEIVGAFALSHGPLLSTPPELWMLRAGDDRKSSRHHYRGNVLDYGSLLATREPGFADEMSDAEKARRHAACQHALDEMARRFRDCRADVAIIFGNDQEELFQAELTPAFTVFAGARIENVPSTPEVLARMPEGIRVAEPGHVPHEGAVYPGAPDVALAIAASLAEQSFDVALSKRMPRQDGARSEGIPHAFGFVYRRLMEDAPPPSVPIFLNVGVAPNIPRAARCLQLGHAVKKAIDALPGDLRVAVVSSGGLSHFTVDEELDGKVIRAMENADEAALAAVPEPYFNGNTCEIKNWYPTVAIMNDHGRKMHVVDYVPCYRTEAGTGHGMAFAYWR